MAYLITTFVFASESSRICSESHRVRMIWNVSSCSRRELSSNKRHCRHHWYTGGSPQLPPVLLPRQGCVQRVQEDHYLLRYPVGLYVGSIRHRSFRNRGCSYRNYEELHQQQVQTLHFFGTHCSGSQRYPRIPLHIGQIDRFIVRGLVEGSPPLVLQWSRNGEGFQGSPPNGTAVLPVSCFPSSRT